MIKAIVYSLEGYELHTAVEKNHNLVSRLESGRAVETWKAGLVKGQLAVNLKTVQSVERLLKQVDDGTLVEITYELVGNEAEVQETRTVRHFPRQGRSTLLAAGTLPMSDYQIVRTLGARLGSYIRVSYRLVDRHEVELEEPQPWEHSYAHREARVLVGAH